MDADLTGPAGSGADPFVGSDTVPVLESQADKPTKTKADMGQRPSEVGQGKCCLSLATGRAQRSEALGSAQPALRSEALDPGVVLPLDGQPPSADLPMVPGQPLEGSDPHDRIFDSDPLSEIEEHHEEIEQLDGDAFAASKCGLHTGPAQPLQTRSAGDGPGSVTADLDEQEGQTNPLEAFLHELMTAPAAPLLQVPPPPPNPPCPPSRKKKTTIAATDGMPRYSGRLAAKPDCGLPSIEKARLVLLRKQGICMEDEQATSSHIERYKQMYKSELPDNFIAAVTSLVAAAAPSRKKKAREEATGSGMAVAAQA